MNHFLPLGNFYSITLSNSFFNIPPSHWLLSVPSSILTIGISLCYILCHPFTCDKQSFPKTWYFTHVLLFPPVLSWAWTFRLNTDAYFYLPELSPSEHVPAAPQLQLLLSRQADYHQFCSFSLLAKSLYLATQHLACHPPC